MAFLLAWGDALVDITDIAASYSFVITTWIRAYDPSERDKCTSKPDSLGADLDSQQTEDICYIIAIALWLLAITIQLVADSLDVFVHCQGWFMHGSTKLRDKLMRGALAVICYALVVLLGVAAFVGVLMALFYYTGNMNGMQFFIVAMFCIWQSANQLGLLIIWIRAPAAVAMSAGLKVPVLGFFVNCCRSSKSKKEVREFRVNILAKEWKCLFLDFPDIVASAVDLFLFSASSWAAWLALVKGLIKCAIIGCRAGFKAKKALEDYQKENAQVAAVPDPEAIGQTAED